MVKKPRVYHYTCINNIYIFKEKKKKGNSSSIQIHMKYCTLL